MGTISKLEEEQSKLLGLYKTATEELNHKTKESDSNYDSCVAKLQNVSNDAFQTRATLIAAVSQIRNCRETLKGLRDKCLDASQKFTDKFSSLNTDVSWDKIANASQMFMMTYLDLRDSLDEHSAFYRGALWMLDLAVFRHVKSNNDREMSKLGPITTKVYYALMNFGSQSLIWVVEPQNLAYTLDPHSMKLDHLFKSKKAAEDKLILLKNEPVTSPWHVLSHHVHVVSIICKIGPKDHIICWKLTKKSECAYKQWLDKCAEMR